MGFRYSLFKFSVDQRSRARNALLAVFAIASVHSTVQANGCNPTLYGTSFEGKNGLATLYSINLINGYSARIGATGFERISGMDTDPATDITYATAEQPGTDTPVLITVDRATGEGTLVGALTIVNEGIAGLSIRNGDGKLYAFGGQENIFTVDSATGMATLLFEKVDEPTRVGNGIAFSPTDVLYHADREELHTVDQSDGELTTVQPLTFNFPMDVRGVAAMDYAPGLGVYYAIVKGENRDTYLASVDVGSGHVDHIGRTVDSMDGLTYVCEPPDPSGKVFKDGFEGQ